MHSHTLQEHKSEYKSEKKPFEIIYQAAKAKDSKTITNILSEACIDVRGEDRSVPIFKLASEGEVEAVDFLRKNFNARKDWMISGYAHGRHVEKVERALRSAKAEERFTMLAYATIGYARGRYVEEVNKLIPLASNLVERYCLLYVVEFCYVREGYKAEVQKISNFSSNHPKNQDNLLKSTIASMNDLEQVRKALANTNDRGKYISFLGWFGNLRALQGSKNQVTEILALGLNASEKFSLLCWIARGYAQVGNKEEINKILTLTFNNLERSELLGNIIENYALGGHITEAKKTLNSVTDQKLKSILLKKMTHGLAYAGNTKEVNTLLKQWFSANDDIEEKDYDADMPSIITEFVEAYSDSKEDSAEKKDSDADIPQTTTEFVLDLDPYIDADTYIFEAEFAEEPSISDEFPGKAGIISAAIFGYALDGNVNEATKWLDKLSNISDKFWIWGIRGFMDNGIINEAIKILMRVPNTIRPPLIREIANYLKKIAKDLKKPVFSHESTLFLLALFPPTFQKDVAKELESKSDIHAMRIVPQATLLHPVLTKESVLTHPVNFRYRVGLAWPYAQEWLLMTGIYLLDKGKINPDTFSAIATFLAPLSNSEAFDLSNRMLTTYRPEFFYSNCLRKECLLAAKKNVALSEDKHTSNYNKISFTGS